MIAKHKALIIALHFVRIVTPPLSKKASHVKKAKIYGFSAFICTKLLTFVSIGNLKMLSEVRKFLSRIEKAA